jgi:hypothetical protein
VTGLDRVIWAAQFVSALGTVWLFCLMVANHWHDPVPRNRAQRGDFLLDGALTVMFFIVVLRQFIFHDPPLPNWVIALTAAAVVWSNWGYWIRTHPNGRIRVPLWRTPGKRRHHPQL